MKFADNTVLLDKVAVGIDSLSAENSTFTIIAVIAAIMIVIAAAFLVVKHVRKNKKTMQKDQKE